MTGRVRIKICGTTRLEDAQLAVALGADAVGFVLWPSSPRAVAPEAAVAISRALPSFVARVGVTVNMPPGEAADIARAAGLTDLQLHGDESAGDYASVGVRLVRAVRLERHEDLEAALTLPPAVTPLVDAGGQERRGGTGRLADWSLAAKLAARRPTILAGGLTPDNVRAAIREVRPWAVDVASGVEASPGIKSAERLRAFFDAVARAGREVDTP